jgi:SagB-type dehydrogenase family enzyme
MSTKAGIQFIHDSEHEYMEKPAADQGVPQPPLEMAHEPALKIIDLPAYQDLSLQPTDLWKTMQVRKTLRRYQESSLSLQELAMMLWFTQGVKEVTDRPVTLRTIPSGGARHPLETYLVVSRIEGLQPGLYRYLALTHKLAFLKEGQQLAEEISQAANGQHHVRDCAVSFWWAVDSVRTTWRYSTRGYRYIMMDAGHVCQNLALAAEGIGCGICEIGAFSDQALNQFFNLDGKEHFVIYGATVGKR